MAFESINALMVSVSSGVVSIWLEGDWKFS